ncbi:type 1 glutamine amidotransferase [Nonomuraea sp. K274]|uniref:Type 1 glutamine amidotransferase n=1 Tax=Nonomuraea cypriaca TaxID=1187855 RepID=A0A931AE07_9ACTN|nr:type 1 glutamine amidotransferase [Nonomuraea cypriaca]MBF8189885.1 type 1 glutamine amidotransferase [Nonomuraea cypriaca]
MRIIVIEHEAGAGLGYLGGWLGMTCEVVRPYLGEAVPERAADGLIVLGGAAAAWEDERSPWQPATRDLLMRAVDDGTPTLAVCLGAQLLTLACGGTVERGANGLEVGLREVTALPAAASDRLLSHIGTDGGGSVVGTSVGTDGASGADANVGTDGASGAGAGVGTAGGSGTGMGVGTAGGSGVGAVGGSVAGIAVAVQYHQDAMTRLPDGAVPLMTGSQYANQAYRLGEAVWAIQFHPEATPEIFASWTAESALDGAEELNAEVKAAESTLIATWRPLAASFAKVVRATGRA